MGQSLMPHYLDIPSIEYWRTLFYHEFDMADIYVRFEAVRFGGKSM
jgi:hypothetical protein